MDKFDLYRDIASRTGGDVYVGVVGPVRTSKSTLIKQVMQKLVVDSIENGNVKEMLEKLQVAVEYYSKI